MMLTVLIITKYWGWTFCFVGKIGKNSWGDKNNYINTFRHIEAKSHHTYSRGFFNSQMKNVVLEILIMSSAGVKCYHSRIKKQEMLGSFDVATFINEIWFIMKKNRKFDERFCYTMTFRNFLVILLSTNFQNNKKAWQYHSKAWFHFL